MRERAVLVVFGIALVTFIGLAVVVVTHFGRFGEQTRWIHHTQEVLTALEETLGELRDVETGQRGYLIAGQQDFLEPYEGSANAVRSSLEAIATMTADNPAQQARMPELRELVDQKIAHAARTIELFRAGDREQARAMVAGRRGKLLMDQIRERIGAMQDEERRLLEQRIERAEVTAWRTNLFILFGNAIAFSFLTTGTILLGRELNRRRRREQELGFHAERTQLLEQATRAQQTLESVVSEVPLGVLLAGGGGEVLLENRRMTELHGGRVARSGQPAGPGGALSFLRPDGTPCPPEEDPLVRSQRRGEVTHGLRLRLIRADDDPVEVIASSAPVRSEEGRVIGAVLLLQGTADLERSQQERRDAERFRDLFLGALGHDLRNPLSVISAGAASLARQSEDPAQARVAARLVSSAARMERMIRQLIDLVQVRLAGGIALDRERTDLGELVRAVVERIEVQQPHRQIELAVAGELVGEWDRVRLSEVVTDLVGNALQHGRADAPVTVTVNQSGPDARLEVHNQGNPIPPALLPLVFDPFRRAEERKRMKSVGLGIGLYLALQIVRAHRGRIDVDSSAEAGTTFRVLLPRTDG